MFFLFEKLVLNVLTSSARNDIEVLG